MSVSDLLVMGDMQPLVRLVLAPIGNQIGDMHP
jgi:hypothetical protein